MTNRFLTTEEVELALLGTFLSEPSCYWDVEVLPEYFASERNRIIFESIRILMDRDKTVDLVSLASHLKDQGFLAKAGGASRLHECVDSYVSAGMVRPYLRILREHYLNRQLVQVGYKAVELAKDETRDPEQKIREAIQDFENALNTIPHSLVTVDRGLKEEFGLLETEFRGQAKPGISFGFKKLDDAIDGLWPGDLIVVPGQTSIGKTAFGLSCVLNFWRNKHPTGFISLEMSKSRIYRRLLAMESKVSLYQLKQGSINSLGSEYWVAIAKATNDLCKLAGTSYIEALIRDRSPRAIYSLGSKMKRENKIQVLVVDHLHRMGGGRGSKYEITTDNVQAIKDIAQDLQIPVILTSQVNRKLQKGEEPGLHHLRDSGAIEEAADSVLFITRDEGIRDKAWIWILKNREGPANIKVAFKWDAAITLFKDWNDPMDPSLRRRDIDDIGRDNSYGEKI